MTDHPDPGNDRLGELLRRAVPDGPEPIGRADSVVRRARRANRSRATVSVLAVGAVAAAVLVGPGLLDNRVADHQATPVPVAPSVSPAPVSHPYTCPAVGQHPRRPTAPPSDSIPPGAVLARICPARGEHLSVWAPPLDALTTHVDVVADAYNSLPTGQPLPCPALPGSAPGFNVTFQYPNGQLVRVSAETIQTGVCAFISIDGRHELGRSDAGTVMRTYFQELQRQRGQETPPVTSVSCPSSPGHLQSGLIPLEPHIDLAKALMCVYQESGFVVGTLERSALLTGHQVQIVNDDYSSSARRDPFQGTCTYLLNGPDKDEVIVGVTRWGDPVVLDSCYGRYFRSPTYADQVFAWEPAASVGAMLNRLAGG